MAALAIGVAALIASAIAGTARPDAFFRAWLAGFSVWIGISLGALMLLMAYDLTGGAWGRAARPPLAAAAAMMPLNAILFLPLLFGLSRLYPWADPAHSAELANRFYLNPSFFLVRALLYFALWLGWTALTQRPAARDPDGKAIGRMTSAPGLIVLGITTTFAAFDWTMSLMPEWSSSIYGLFVTAGDLLAAAALAALTAGLLPLPLALPSRERTADPADPLGDIGSLMLAGILLLTYLAVMQFVIIWEENLPDEIPWYLHRLVDGWQGFDWLLALVQVVLPFAILIAWPLKRRPGWLRTAAVLLLLGHVLDQWWLVLPPHRIDWLTPAVLVATGGIWLALFDLRLERGRLLFGGSAGAVPGETHG